MTPFFTGWLGYGNAYSAGVLAEPGDPAYRRRPFVLGDIDNGIVRDVGAGTVGPATVSWGSIGYAALFDAQVGGNLLLWFPLMAPIAVAVGGTLSTSGGSFSICFPDLRRDPLQTHTWPAGSPVATTGDGRNLTSFIQVQAVGGQLSASSSVLASAVVLASLPATQQASGSGLLWNNGGMISVS